MTLGARGRPVLGRPVLYTGSANGAFVAWMDPQLTRPGRRARHRRPAGLAVGWPGRARPAAVPRGVVQRRLQVGRLRRRRPRVRRVVPQPGRGRGVVHRLRRRHVHRRRVGARQRSRQAGRRRCARTSACSSTAARRPPAASNPGSWGASVGGGRDHARRRRASTPTAASSGPAVASARSTSPTRSIAGRRGAGDGDGHQPRLGELQLVRRRARQRRPRATVSSARPAPTATSAPTAATSSPCSCAAPWSPAPPPSWAHRRRAHVKVK